MAAQAGFPGANDDVVNSAVRKATHEANQTNTAGAALVLLGLGLVVAAVEVTRRVRRESANAKVLRDSQAAMVLLEALAVSANEAATIEAAVQVCLDRVCQYTGWLLGHAYVSGRRGEMTSSPVWHLDRPDRFRDVRLAVEQMQFTIGKGGVGRAILTGRAKQAGRDRSVVFADSMRTRALQRLDTEVALRRAIADGELVCTISRSSMSRPVGPTEWKRWFAGSIPPEG